MRKKRAFRLIGFGKYEVVETEIKEPRPLGFYWVKYEGNWQIAEWMAGKWVFNGDIGMFMDDHFDKIHEKRIEEPMYN